MKFLGVFKPTDTATSNAGQINSTIRPGDNARLLMTNLSSVHIRLIFPNSDDAILMAGHTRIFPTSDWPNSTVYWQALAQSYASVGSQQNFQFMDDPTSLVSAAANEIVICELYGPDEEIGLSLPRYSAAQIGIGNFLNYQQMTDANLYYKTDSFTGNTNPSNTPPIVPTINPSYLFYVDGFSIFVAPTGAAKVFTVAITGLTGSKSLDFLYWSSTTGAITDTQMFPFPLASATTSAPCTFSISYSGSLGGSNQGQYSWWGHYVAYDSVV